LLRRVWRRVGEAMKAHGYEKERRNVGYVYLGLGLQVDDDQADDDGAASALSLVQSNLGGETV
jgi:hypothetical protein